MEAQGRCYSSARAICYVQISAEYGQIETSERHSVAVGKDQSKASHRLKQAGVRASAQSI